MGALWKNNRTTNIVLLLTVLLCFTSAFQAPFRHASLQHPYRPCQIEKPVVRTPFSFRRSLVLQNQRNDKDSKETRGYTGVEDGSPLGVAIVFLGGSLVVYGGDDFANIPIWVVFVTASTAAGVARLIRYWNNKEN